MPISVTCPSCGAKLRAPDNAAGRKLACSQCRKSITVPTVDPPPQTVTHSRPQNTPVQAAKACPACGESILATAKKCKHCGERLDEPAPVLAVAAPKPRRSDVDDDDDGESGQRGRGRAGQTTVIVNTPKEFPHLLHLIMTFFTCGAWLPVYAIHGLVASKGGGMTLALMLGVPVCLVVLGCGGCLTLAALSPNAGAGRPGSGSGPVDVSPAPAAARPVPAKSAGGGNVRANRNLQRDEFRALVLGKSPDELIAAIGKPNSTQDTEIGLWWYYENVAVDPVTGKRSMLVQITIENGRVTGVNFN
jgi:hypothetical protein